MAEIPVNFLLEKLSTFLVKEAQLLGGMGKQIEEIREELNSIQAFLKDADRKKNHNSGIKTWVEQLRCVAYDVEDTIDQFALRFGRRNEGGGITNAFNTLLTAMKRPFASHDLANSIQEIKGRIKNISERRLKYGIELIDEGDSSEATIRQWQGHREANFLDKAEVVGIEKDVELLMDQLVGITDVVFATAVGGLGTVAGDLENREERGRLLHRTPAQATRGETEGERQAGVDCSGIGR